MNRIFLRVLLLILLSSCTISKDEQELSFVLEHAGNNKKELEHVLNHYTNDSEKLAAAKFLITNMIGKSESRSSHQDSIKCILSQALRNKQTSEDELIVDAEIVKSWSNRSGYPQRLQDIQLVTADFLIKNIDLAFLVWKKYPWNRSLSFEDFCEYILPYRVGDEPIDNWREIFYNKYSPVLDTYKGNDVVEACNMLIRELQKDSLYYNTDFSIPHMGGEFLFYNRLGSCREGCDIGIYTMRACGIPVATDQYVYSPTYKGGHSWNVVRDTTGRFLPFWYTQFEARRDMKDDGRRKGKVFRRFFGKQQHDMAKNTKSAQPALFRDPFIKDVSANYFGENEICIPIRTDTETAFLGVFSPEKWIVVDKAPEKGNKSIFRGIETNVVFQPLILQNGNLVPEGFPFVYNGKKTHFFVPDTARKEYLSVTRKFPLRQYGIDYMNKNMHGARIEGDNTPTFKNPVLLAVTPDTIIKNRYVVELPETVYCRYIRFQSPDSKQIELAELSIYGESLDTPLMMKVLQQPSSVEFDAGNLCDNDPLTYFISEEKSCSVIFDLGNKTKIQQVAYVPHNDENFITPGDQYELFYQNGREGWKSLGIQSSDSGVLHFQIPHGGLFWLKNNTQGVEGQVFFSLNGKQIFSCDIDNKNEIYH